MNRIAKKHCLPVIFFLSTGCNVLAAESDIADEAPTYEVTYTVVPYPSQESLDIIMSVRQTRSLLREIRFPVDARISAVSADGELRVTGDEVIWRPQQMSVARLRWNVSAPHRRNNSGYDAWLGEDWGLMRAEDLVPRATSRTLRGAISKTSLQFRLPAGWSVVTPYAEKNGSFAISKSQRRFDQPDGWIVMGRLGVRRDTVAGMRIAIAGPVDHAIRRMDTLALLRWVMPEWARVLPDLPPRLTIVSAGDPMWRGGLSAPQSLYIHSQRPLISENSTSTLLHEVVHSTLRISTKSGYDWIAEGLAEYYSLELLRRSGTISPSRHRQALRSQEQWSKSASKLCRKTSSGATTALAVVIFAALDKEIRLATNSAASLDDLVATLSQITQSVDLQTLRNLARQIGDEKSQVLATDNLPGCKDFSQADTKLQTAR